MVNIEIEIAGGASIVEPPNDAFDDAEELVDWLLARGDSQTWLETRVGWVRTDQIVRVLNTTADPRPSLGGED